MANISERYTVLKEFRTIFNPELFNEKFAHVLLKYDFLVGDYSDEQLRLKGFYHNKRHNINPKLKATAINKYIKESCNYMCSHYVLEKKEQTSQQTKYDKKRKGK